MQEIRVGVIGSGRMGKIRVENLSKMPGIEVVTLVTHDVEDILPWAHTWGISNITDDASRIFEDESITAVVICSPTDSHAEYVKQAARCGKHIFCEKPIANGVAETKEVLDIVAEAGVVFQLGFNRRYDPNFIKLRELCSSGELGDIHVINISSRDPARPPIEFVAHSGGMFVDMMIHDFDMLRYLTGSEIEEVYASGEVLIDPRIGEADDVDTAVVVVKLANGAICTIDNSRETHYGYDQRVEVFGSGGSAYAKNKTGHNVEVSTKEGVERDKPLHYLVERYMDSFGLEIRGFISALRQGVPPTVGGADGLKALLGSVAADKSARENRPVRISSVL